MAQSIDANSGLITGGAGTTTTWSHTVTSSGGNRVLIVIAGQSSGGALTCTYAGQAMTSVASSSGGGGNCHIFYKANPATGANDVVVTKANNIPLKACSVSLLDSKQTVGATSSGANGTSPPATLTLTTTGTGNGIVFDGGRSDTSGYTWTVGAGQTQLFNSLDNDNKWGLASYETYTGGADVTMSWTGSGGVTWELNAVEVEEDIFVPTGHQKNVLTMGVG